MASVVVRQGQQILREIRLYKTSLEIGRSSDCEIQLPDNAVSRRHARIVRADDGYFVEDLGGKNGVFVNEGKTQRAQLHNLDRILIPPFQLDFLAEEWQPEPEAVVVEVKDVCKEYALGKQTVVGLKDISFNVAKGEFLALAGPSGSGKSTLLNLIGCIDSPTSGSIRIGGQDVAGKTADELADLRLNTLGFVFQTFNLLPVLSARENVEYPLLQQKSVSPAERRERVDRYLTIVGLDRYAKHRPNELSGGQRQRVAIARALATRPRIVLADEPTANLDHKTGEGILKLMKQLNHEQGTTFIFSTHDRRVMEMADRVIELADGRISE